MKTCVFILGTNCVGKTSLAKALIESYGGIKSTEKQQTICNDSRYAFVGKYTEASKFGGVDALNNTRELQSICQALFQQSEVVICEGRYMNTIGINLTNAMFEAQKQLVVFLWCPINVINERLQKRSQTGATLSVAKAQRCVLNAANKYSKIGVPVLTINTSEMEFQEEVTMVRNKIDELAGLQTAQEC